MVFESMFPERNATSRIDRRVGSAGTATVLLLHLLPGILFLPVFLVLARVFSRIGAPALLAVYIAGSVTLIPFFAIVLIRSSGAVHYRQKVSPRIMIPAAVCTLAWAVLVFAVISPYLADPIQENLFGWIPDWADFAGQYRDPAGFDRSWLILTWVVGAGIGSVAIPVAEELYFRGYLLPRLGRLGAWAPLVNTVLFAVYHFAQPWLIPTRILATAPLFYAVWWKRNVTLAIAVHVALNLVGDTILSIPAVFG